MTEETRRRGLRARAAGGVLRFEILLQASVLALDRWERLTPDDQQRFEELARRAGRNPRQNLSASEYKHLRTIWKRLDVSGFLREAARLVARRS